MPRDGSNIYHKPAGTDGVPNTTVATTPYNSYTADVEQDLNLPRPIVAGGTGASSVVGALANLTAEQYKQVVTNWDAMTWAAGSFYAATTATGTSPVVGHAFAGVVYYANATDFVLQAIDLTSAGHEQFVRIMSGGVWGAWAADDASVFVKKAGDTMTGDLTINSAFLTVSAAAPSLNLTKSASGNASGIMSRLGSALRWILLPGDTTAETGSNVGSDFVLQAYTDAAAPVTPPALTIKRALNRLLLAGDPVAALDAATKQYVDAATTLANTKVAKAGDTMTGLLLLSGDPVAALGAVTRQYADAATDLLSPCNCGYFLFSSATSVQFQPFNGDTIKINGVVSRIPAANINAANTGVFVNGVAGQNLAVSTLYYVYLFNNAGTLTIDFSTTSAAVSGAPGNVGVYIKSGDNTRSLIGLVFTNASAQFVAANVISWYNKKTRQVTTSGGWTNAAGQLPVDFCTWQEEAISYHVNTYMTNNTLYGLVQVTPTIDGANQPLGATTQVPVANSQGSVAASATAQLSTGHHTIAQSIFITGGVTSSIGQTSVLFRG